MAQYHVAQLARRLYGGKLAPKAEHLERICQAIADGTFDDDVAELKGMSLDDLKAAYTGREMEPHMADESWKPQSDRALLG
jgi:hypothetical protein